MAMPLVLSSALLVPALSFATGEDVKTIVNNVPWWPQSNLQVEEAVGVVSRGVLFATGMLEATEIGYSMRHFNSSQLNLELLDVRDIVKAANTSLGSLVDCVASVPAGASAEATRTLQEALGGANGSPCITVLETLGEDPEDYPGHVYNSSISCFASTADAPAVVRHYQQGPRGRRHTAVKIADQGNGMVWIRAEASGRDAVAAAEFWGEVQTALTHVSFVMTTDDIVDCTLFLPPDTTETIVAAVQRAVANHTEGVGGQYVAAQLTTVKVGMGGNRTQLRCTAIADGRSQKQRPPLPPSPAPGASSGGGGGPATSASVVVAGGFAYVSGIGSTFRNATDGFAELRRALEAAGSRLNLILNCMFFVSSQSVIEPFFHGFHDTFNRDANNRTAVGFPPPSRIEFVGESVSSQCLRPSAGCPVLSKCVAAMPEKSDQMRTGAGLSQRRDATLQRPAV
jgi:hypothetical protein